MKASALATPITARAVEIKAVNAVARTLGSKRGKARLSGPDGQVMLLPDSLYTTLLEAARALSAGKSIRVMPIDSELTTQEAAEFLSVSRPFLIKQLEEGKMPFHLVGTHRRIKLADLMAFKDSLRARKANALQQLVDESQDMGLYDE
jgi:excisionase family DNA binding protein